MKIKKMLAIQKKFSDEFFNVSEMTEAEKVERHKVFCLSMHAEMSRLANTVHYRDHRPIVTATHRQNILFETMDVFRYTLAMLNLWGFDAREVKNAFTARDAHLNCRATKNIESWDGRPVVVVDMDDVLTRFRTDFYDWVNKKYDENLDHMSDEYYFSRTIGGKSGDAILGEFINEGKMRTLGVNENIRDGLQRLQNAGYWIHILTARPATELKCLYETFGWLIDNIPAFDSISLFPEKYLSLAGTKAYAEGKVVCAIDDSPKHAAEFAQHGIPVLVPRRNYNRSIWKNDNIKPFDWEKDNIKKIVVDLDNCRSTSI